MPATVVVRACQRAPRTNKTSATRITLFRPSLSASILATGLARRAQRLVQLVIKLLSSVPRGRWERSEPMQTRVEDMTPVLNGGSCHHMLLPKQVSGRGQTYSYPNRSPLIPAEKVRANMNQLGDVKSCSRKSTLSDSSLTSVESSRMRGACALLTSSSMVRNSTEGDAVMSDTRCEPVVVNPHDGPLMMLNQ